MRNALFAAVAALSFAAPANAYSIFFGDLTTGTHSYSNGQLQFTSTGNTFNGSPFTLAGSDTLTITQRVNQPGWSYDFSDLALDFFGLRRVSAATITATFQNLDGSSQTLSWLADSTRVNTPDAPSFTYSATFSVSGGSIELDQLVFDAVPEPANWALMIVGFGLAGASLRHLRSKPGTDSASAPANVEGRVLHVLCRA